MYMYIGIIPLNIPSQKKLVGIKTLQSHLFTVVALQSLYSCATLSIYIRSQTYATFLYLLAYLLFSKEESNSSMKKKKTTLYTLCKPTLIYTSFTYIYISITHVWLVYIVYLAQSTYFSFYFIFFIGKKATIHVGYACLQSATHCIRFPHRRRSIYTLRFLPYTTLYIFTLTFIFKYLTIATPMPAIKCPAHLSVCYYKPFVSASK